MQQKAEILRLWEYDACEIGVAGDEGMSLPDGALFPVGAAQLLPIAEQEPRALFSGIAVNSPDLPKTRDNSVWYLEIPRNLRIRQSKIRKYLKATFWRWAQNMQVFLQFIGQIVSVCRNFGWTCPTSGAEQP